MPEATGITPGPEQSYGRLIDKFLTLDIGKRVELSQAAYNAQAHAKELILPRKGIAKPQYTLPWDKIETDQQAMDTVLLENYYDTLQATFEATNIALTLRSGHHLSDSDRQRMLQNVRANRERANMGNSRTQAVVGSGDWGHLKEKWAWAVRPPAVETAWSLYDKSKDPMVANEIRNEQRHSLNIYKTKTEPYDTEAFDRTFRRLPQQPNPQNRREHPSTIDPQRIVQGMMEL